MGGIDFGISRKTSGIKKRSRFDTGRISRGIICFQNRYFKMGIWCLSYNRTKLDETQ